MKFKYLKDLGSVKKGEVKELPESTGKALVSHKVVEVFKKKTKE